MVKVTTFVVAAAVGAILGVVGVVAMLGSLSPSADAVAEETSSVSVSSVYGTR